MSPLYRRFVVLAVGFLLLLTPLASAAAVEALFDLSSTITGPFPSDRFTLFDHDNKTGLRVSLPKPDCAVRPTDCADESGPLWVELCRSISVPRTAGIVKGFRMPAGRRRAGMHGGRRPKSLEGGNRGGVRTDAGVGLWGFRGGVCRDLSVFEHGRRLGNHRGVGFGRHVQDRKGGFVVSDRRFGGRRWR